MPNEDKNESKKNPKLHETAAELAKYGDDYPIDNDSGDDPDDPGFKFSGKDLPTFPGEEQ